MQALAAACMLCGLPAARSVSRRQYSLVTKARCALKQHQNKKIRTATCRASALDLQLLEDKKFRESQLENLQCNYCRRCGSAMNICIPDGEDELRHQCSSCGYVEYHNPKTVVGCLVEHEGRVLLCKRALEPCSGLWTLPAGYMELHESSYEGACRETWEEACARVRVIGPYAHLDIPVIGQSYLIFRAYLAAPHTFAAGPESAEVGLFAPEQIPFQDIAFSSISLTLQQWVEDKRRGVYSCMHGVIRKKPGASPRDPKAFELTDVHHTEVGADI